MESLASIASLSPKAPSNEGNMSAVSAHAKTIKNEMVMNLDIRSINTVLLARETKALLRLVWGSEITKLISVKSSSLLKTTASYR